VPVLNNAGIKMRCITRMTRVEFSERARNAKTSRIEDLAR